MLPLPQFNPPTPQPIQALQPNERDVNVNALMLAHGIAKNQAVAHLISAKTKSREQFVLDTIKEKTESLSSYQPTTREVEDMGTIYDRAIQAGY